MATLQTIRSKGPLLVIVIGLALFAFIAGDAWKILQPHQGKQDVGEVNGETLSAQDYQKMVDELSEVIKLTNGLNSLNEDQLSNVKDQVWQSYVNNKLIAAEAEKLGLTVTDAELQAIIDQGTHPMLMQTPFRNPQTGAFDKDMLKKFLVDYANLNNSQMPAQYVEYYQTLIRWLLKMHSKDVQNRATCCWLPYLTLQSPTQPFRFQTMKSVSCMTPEKNSSSSWLKPATSATLM